MEAAMRTAYELVTGTRTAVRTTCTSRRLSGLSGVKEASLKIEGHKARVELPRRRNAATWPSHTGLGNAERVISAIKSGEKQYHFVEIMACPGGCIGGGGQPRYTNNAVRQARIDAIYREDEGKQLRKSHENPAIMQLYSEFLTEGPLGHRSHELLHTTYTPREKA